MAFHLLVATPTHSGAIDSVTADTLLQLQRALLARGDDCTVRFPSATTISTLRNLIVADFLGSGADALFMLDADQGLPVANVLRMIDLDRPVVGCLYPRRQYDWSAVRAGAGGDPGRMVYQAMDFVGALDSGPDGAVEVQDGFARAAYLGAGSLLVRREALSTLMDAYPDLAGRGFHGAEFPGPRFAANWGFFNPLARDEGGDLLAEDFSFCQRWRGAGGELWADLTAPAAHVGRHMFSGSYLDYLDAVAPRL